MSSRKQEAAPPVPTPRAPSKPVVDEHHGRGGSYVIKDGKRVLQARTLTADEAAAKAKEVGDAD